MRAIILAAGRGTRMGARTAQHPKALTPLANRPLIRWQLDALREAGLRQVAVVRGYLGHLLCDPDYAVFDNPRWAEANMVVSLACAREWLEAESCVVSYADILFHPDAVRALMRSQGDVAISYDRQWLLLWADRFADPLTDAETFRLGAGGLLEEIGRRPSSAARIQGQYMGLLKFRPPGWARVQAVLEGLAPEERDRLDMTALIQRLLDAAIPVATVPVDGRWCEVDSARDLEVYEARLAGGRSWTHDWRW